MQGVKLCRHGLNAGYGGRNDDGCNSVAPWVCRMNKFIDQKAYVGRVARVEEDAITGQFVITTGGVCVMECGGRNDTQSSHSGAVDKV